MINQDTIEEINKMIEGCLAEESFDLIELISFREARILVLRLIIDRPEGGITLGECASVNRKIIDRLDADNILSENYTLEVSSPGIDRVLKTQKDFQCCVNKTAVFYLSQLIEGKCEWQGIIKQVNDSYVFIEKAGRIVKIPLDKINKSKLII